MYFFLSRNYVCFFLLSVLFQFVIYIQIVVHMFSYDLLADVIVHCLSLFMLISFFFSNFILISIVGNQIPFSLCRSLNDMLGLYYISSKDKKRTRKKCQRRQKINPNSTNHESLFIYSQLTVNGFFPLLYFSPVFFFLVDYFISVVIAVTGLWFNLWSRFNISCDKNFNISARHVTL